MQFVQRNYRGSELSSRCCIKTSGCDEVRTYILPRTFTGEMRNSILQFAMKGSLRRFLNLLAPIPNVDQIGPDLSLSWDDRTGRTGLQTTRLIWPVPVDRLKSFCPTLHFSHKLWLSRHPWLTCVSYQTLFRLAPPSLTLVPFPVRESNQVIPQTKPSSNSKYAWIRNQPYDKRLSSELKRRW